MGHSHTSSAVSFGNDNHHDDAPEESGVSRTELEDFRQSVENELFRSEKLIKENRAVFMELQRQLWDATLELDLMTQTNRSHSLFFTTHPADDMTVQLKVSDPAPSSPSRSYTTPTGSARSSGATPIPKPQELRQLKSRVKRPASADTHPSSPGRSEKMTPAVEPSGINIGIGGLKSDERAPQPPQDSDDEKLEGPKPPSAP